MEFHLNLQIFLGNTDEWFWGSLGFKEILLNKIKELEERKALRFRRIILKIFVDF